MCGILAHLVYDREARVDEQTLRAMADTMTHRGPDDAGYWVRGNVGLAHRRLSIIDLSAAGRQPMANEDESIFLTFNGEIYNFESLRAQLVAAGHRFRSSSDSEVILHGYEEWGAEGCLSRLRGMFGFAIWDEPRRTLFAARDRVGIKPVYYREDGRSLILASEIKAILRHPEARAGLDELGLIQHFSHRFTLPPRTAFAGISKLEAGHYIVAREGRVQVGEYWRPPGEEALDRSERSPEDWSEELHSRLWATVKDHMIADVPVGAFLSGGMDSSSLVAVASDHADRPLDTYTAGFGPGWHDETPHAQRVADHLGTHHHQVVIEPASPDFLEKVLWHLEEPLINTSVIPLFAVAELASRDVKVVLAGEGSDEANGGYERYARIDTMLRLRRYRKAVPGVDRLLDVLVRGLPSNPFTARAKRLNRMTHSRATAFDALSSTALTGHSDGERDLPLFVPELMSAVPERTRACSAALLAGYEGVTDPVRKFILYDLRGWLANELLIRGDKITMAHSLEARVPYIDHELLEFCLAIPRNLKISGGETKALLRRTMRPHLPPETSRRPQHGFVVPLAHWFRTQWKELVMDLAADRRTRERGIFDAANVDEMVAAHMSESQDWTGQLFGFVQTELWHRVFIDAG